MSKKGRSKYNNVRVECRGVDGYPGYRVGDDGSVWSHKRAWAGWVKLKPAILRGHLAVSLQGPDRKPRLRYVHRLVLEAFVGPCPAGMEARHTPDRDPTNNCIKNLCWGTPKENSSDTIRDGMMPRGSKHGRAKLTEADIPSIRERHAAGESTVKIARALGVNPTTIQRIIKGKRWTHA